MPRLVPFEQQTLLLFQMPPAGEQQKARKAPLRFKKHHDNRSRSR
jgi:hypothetical protein